MAPMFGAIFTLQYLVTIVVTKVWTLAVTMPMSNSSYGNEMHKTRN